MRVQRTRSSPSAPRSPLTSGPLGAFGFATALGLALVCSTGCRNRHRVYVLAPDTPPGEIVIERGNPACPAVVGDELHVPASGYLCTSLPNAPGCQYRRYEIEGPTGRRSLTLERDIFNHTAFQFGRRGCEMVGESFFYLPNGAKVQSEADKSKLFQLHHDCDPSVRSAGGA
jgi:hypothetical protein